MTGTAPHDPSVPPAGPASTSTGPGRALVGVYGVFALSASARAGYQIATKLAEAPLAYGLSAFSAVVYILATVALAKGGGRWRPVAWSAVLVELVGVLVVGTVSVLAAGDFPAKTVWSGYGQGYGYVPLVLPFLGLAWLWHTRSRSADGGSGTVVDQ
ncbi:MAG TPA: hypothetical protein VFW79_15610 [Cellulomonas sp.]|uniref:hypothetical protein n=1 Tax=Cellulomonas sp. TaxID=40001 RepID=UPI002E2F91AA|nr:hypothetical protein [Cellulomonas sp.]HEX5334061.1 hypothetical protein [Cellulomonas sp.]